MSAGVRLVVCINRRLGSGQRSCAGSGSLALIERIETMIEERGIEAPVVRRECLGRCEQGPTMRIAPGGPLFTEIDEAALAVIVDELRLFIDSRHGYGN
ncbi:MAG: (2Fe-2S) ferredoxin domain-containing protein [Gammaproteobacteria bacterium]|jgi:(2Fe-2S) ferredoxin